MPTVNAARRCVAMLALGALASCSSLPKTPVPNASAPPSTPAVPAASIPAQACPPPAPVAACPAPPDKAPQLTWAGSLAPVAWDTLPDWDQDAVQDAFSAFLRSCGPLRAQPAWQPTCEAALQVDPRDADGVRRFFRQRFTPYRVANPDGSGEGLMTGYYEPLLKGSRTQGPKYRYPLYGTPDDLITVDLSEVYPELKPMRLRGRLDGRRIVPYYTRADIESGKGTLTGREILWTDDEVELFFLQVQGSGKVMLDGGGLIRVSYADQNGHPYRSLGRYLVDQGELTVEQASLAGIKAWAERNPDKLAAALNHNPSYVFFREVPANDEGPPGAMGVPVTAGRTLAVDPRAIPLGAPVFISTTWPGTATPLNRLMVAQDTGGAIKGAVRADFYWGSGADAGAQAGRMRQRGKLWVLLPNGFSLTP